MELSEIAEEISKDWKGLSDGLPYEIGRGNTIYFPYLTGDDIVKLMEFGKQHSKRVYIYPWSNKKGEPWIKISFKNKK